MLCKYHLLLNISNRKIRNLQYQGQTEFLGRSGELDQWQITDQVQWRLRVSCGKNHLP